MRRGAHQGLCCFRRCPAASASAPSRSATGTWVARFRFTVPPLLLVARAEAPEQGRMPTRCPSPPDTAGETEQKLWTLDGGETKGAVITVQSAGEEGSSA